MKINNRKIFRCLKIIVLIYAVIGIALFYLQETFLFHPKKVDADTPYNFSVPFSESRIAFNEEDTMSLVKFLPDAAMRKDYAPLGIVIYYHGNMENVAHYAAYAKPFTEAGYEVWMPDYPGFGKSTGVITEDKLYDQAIEVKRMADAAASAENIIIYGKSLGTGIAAYVASVSKAKLLVLETPYYSIPSLFGNYAFIYPTEAMSKFKIPTYQFLENVTMPVVIFHGTCDNVIPLRCAKKLKKNLKTGDRFIIVAGADHQNINASAKYFHAIDSLLR